MKAHPLAELIPPMAEAEYRELCADVKAHGLREPVTLYEGRILDGRHRYRACQEVGVEPTTKDFDGDSPLAYVISLNVHRRNLTTGQRAEIARQALPRLREEAEERQKRLAGTRSTLASTDAKVTDRSGRAAKQAADLVGVSEAAVTRTERIARERPDLHKKVKAGEMTVNAAFEETAGYQTKGGTPKVRAGKREVTRSGQILQNLVQRFETTRMVLRETNVEAAVQAINQEEAQEWASQLRTVRTELSRLITALERPRGR